MSEASPIGQNIDNSIEHTEDTIELDNSFPKKTQSSNITIPLKEHQATLLKACRMLEDSCNNELEINNGSTITKIKSKFGIIGDMVGSGKTLTILAIIADKLELNNKLPKISVKSNLLVCHEEPINYHLNISSFNIIVVPHTIFKQWSETITKFTNLKYYGINNTKSLNNFKSIFNDEEQSKNFDSSIILISNTRFNEFIHLNLRLS